MDRLTATPYTDGCPHCVMTYNRPLSITDTSADGVRCQYRCPACLWSWWTSYATYRPGVER